MEVAHESVTGGKKRKKTAEKIQKAGQVFKMIFPETANRVVFARRR